MTTDMIGCGNREATAITLVVALPCGLACTGSVIPTLVLGALALVLVAARWLARWVRERIEDRADDCIAARWRAAHAPHLLTASDNAILGRAAPAVARSVA